MIKNHLRRLSFAALMLAAGMLLPLLLGQVQVLGQSLLPMHLPVLLCGVLCGWKYGFAVGAILPIFRSLTFGMPMLFPNAVAMTFELAAYGFFIGFLYARRKGYSRLYLLACLVCAMIAGRVVWGIAQAILLGYLGQPFGFSPFITAAFLNGIAGIVIQLVAVPLAVEIAEQINQRKT